MRNDLNSTRVYILFSSVYNIIYVLRPFDPAELEKPSRVLPLRGVSNGSPGAEQDIVEVPLLDGGPFGGDAVQECSAYHVCFFESFDAQTTV